MPNCKRIVLVLDSSGSMSTQKLDIIGGINEMIKEQRKILPEQNNSVQFNVVKFNHLVEEPTGSTLANTSFLTSRDYIPSGTTALYDAMGKTMDRYRDEKDVIMIIATDGAENASQSYTHRLVTDMVSQFKESKGWNFIYLSEDIDTFRQGNRIGITHESYACNNLNVGKGNIGSTLSDSFNQECISQMRMGNKNVKMKSVDRSSHGHSHQPTGMTYYKSYNPEISRFLQPQQRGGWW